VPANSGPSTPPTPRLRGRATRFAPRALMWAAIGLSVVLFGLLIALGWRDNAGSIAAAFLLLACVAVCVWAGVHGRIADREVDRAIARMVAAREDDQRRRLPTRGTPDG
jgi:hypothetical protein